MKTRSFLDFVADETTTNDYQKNWHYPTEDLPPLIAKQGDFWRCLIDKSTLLGYDPTDWTARLVKQNRPCNKWDGTWLGADAMVALRNQYSSLYTEFVIQVADVSTPESPRQFALVRKNGQVLLSTIAIEAATPAEYAAQIKKAWEAYPYAKVIGWQDGEKLSIRVYHNTAFVLRDELVSIGTGLQAESNTNDPRLTIKAIGDPTAKPAQYQWDIVIDGVEEGNIFRLNGKSYVAKQGDTPSVVLEALNEGSDILILPTIQTPTLSTEAGGRTPINNNKPSIRLDFVNNVGGKDRYAVTIGEDITEGNVYEITAIGTSPKQIVATKTTTPSDVRAALVAASGYYEANTGVTPTEKAIAGTITVANDILPIFYLTNQVTIPATTVTRYAIIIDSDVVAGNVFWLNQKSYTAQIGDGAIEVAKGLGLTDISTIATFETQPVGYAEVGRKTYPISRIKILQQPKSHQSNQCVLEAYFKTLPTGVYAIELSLNPITSTLLGAAYIEKTIDPDATLTNQTTEGSIVWNVTTGSVWQRSVFTGSMPPTSILLPGNVLWTQIGQYKQPKLYSNLLIVGERLETSMIEVADSGVVYGYDYQEPALTQRIRLPIFLKPTKQRIEENRAKKIDGSYERTATHIEYTQELITTAQKANFHATLAAWLKHRLVWINEDSYYCEGSYNESTPQPYEDYWIATATMVQNQDSSNRGRYSLSSPLSDTYGRVVLRNYTYGLQVSLRNAYHCAVIREESELVKPSDYEIIIKNDGDGRTVQVYYDGLKSGVGVRVPARSVIRLKKPIRVSHRAITELVCERNFDEQTITYIPVYTNSLDEQIEVITYLTQTEQRQNTEFDEGFNQEFST